MKVIILGEGVNCEQKSEKDLILKPTIDGIDWMAWETIYRHREKINTVIVIATEITREIEILISFLNWVIPEKRV